MSPTPEAPRKRPVAVLALVGVVVLLAIVAIVVASSGDDDGDDQVTAGDSPPATLGIAPVAIEGDPLPELDRSTASDPTSDPAIGLEVPTIRGTTPAGGSLTIGPAQDGESPTLVAVVAHWCPHCNAEVPRLVELFASGDIPEGTRIIALSTNAREGAPNYPPGEWLDGLDWPGEVVLDDADATAMRALGAPGFPFVVVFDGEGRVVGRVLSENSEDLVAEFLREAAGA